MTVAPARQGASVRAGGGEVMSGGASRRRRAGLRTVPLLVVARPKVIHRLDGRRRRHAALGEATLRAAAGVFIERDRDQHAHRLLGLRIGIVAGGNIDIAALHRLDRRRQKVLRRQPHVLGLAGRRPFVGLLHSLSE